MSKRTFVSHTEIDNTFLDLLKCYVSVKIIPVDTMGGLKRTFKNLEKDKLDYLYADTFNLLSPSFFLRERFGLNIPLIFTIHSVFYWIERYVKIIPLIRKDDIIIAPSVYAKESFLKISDKFNIRIIPYALDIEFIRGNAADTFKKHPDRVISFLGRVTEAKGIGTLIKCMPDVISRVKDARLVVVGPLSEDMAGDHPKSVYVRKIEKQIRRLGLTQKVYFEGMVTGIEKYKILSGSDIFVNPTLAPEEAFPIVNIEALACGLPVVATDWAGNREVIVDGKNGYLVDVENGKDGLRVNTACLTSLIIKVLKNKKLNLKLKRNALKSSGAYDYRKWLPKFAGLLKKRKKAHVENRWGLIKNKRITDFKDLFNKDFLFFLYYRTHLASDTYALLYKQTLGGCLSRKKRIHGIKTIRIEQKMDKEVRILEKISSNLADLLLLRER